MQKQSRKNILIVSFTIPYPVNEGGKIYLFGSVDYLRKYYNITLLLKVLTPNDLQNINHLKNLWTDVRIEIADYNTTTTGRKTGIAAKALYKVSDLIQMQLQSNNLESKPLEVRYSNSFTLMDEKFVSKLKDIFEQSDFDIVQVEFTFNLSLVSLIPDKSISVFVEIESRNLAFNDYLNLQGIDPFYRNYLIENTKLLEYAYMSKYDAIVGISHDDVTRLAKALPGKKVLFNQYCVLDEHIRTTDEIADFSADKLVFMGSESNPPNKDAVEWLIRSILPLISAQFDITLYITGSWSDVFVRRFKDVPNVVFTGFVQDISSVLKNSILVVPIRVGGGGIRAKVIQAMAFGIPIVSTALGCNGVGATHGDSIMIADDESEFVESVQTIKSDANLAAQLIENAHKLIEQNYRQTVTGEQRRNIYESLLSTKN